MATLIVMSSPDWALAETPAVDPLTAPVAMMEMAPVWPPALAPSALIPNELPVTVAAAMRRSPDPWILASTPTPCSELTRPVAVMVRSPEPADTALIPVVSAPSAVTPATSMRRSPPELVRASMAEWMLPPFPVTFCVAMMLSGFALLCVARIPVRLPVTVATSIVMAPVVPVPCATMPASPFWPDPVASTAPVVLIRMPPSPPLLTTLTPALTPDTSAAVIEIPAPSDVPATLTPYPLWPSARPVRLIETAPRLTAATTPSTVPLIELPKADCVRMIPPVPVVCSRLNAVPFACTPVSEASVTSSVTSPLALRDCGPPISVAPLHRNAPGVPDTGRHQLV